MDADLVARLRADLAAADYTVEHLRRLWGDDAEAALLRGRRTPALRAIAGIHDPAATLATLFVLGVAVPRARADAALPSLGVDGAVALGVLAASEDTALAEIDLRPYAFVDAGGEGSWWIASDLGELATGRALRTDHVLGVGGASLTLSGLLLPTRARRALDLGTGSGIQALHLSRIADEVVATDISQRALDFAALTAGLNGVELDLRLGSLFEPVAGERFDRIASNPPFVITPRRADVPEYEYRDGGMVGDALLARVIAGVPDQLEPGGIAQLLGNWEYRDGADGLERAAGWAQASGLDYWIIERETQDPESYAETWIRDGGTPRTDPAFEPLVDAWLEDFASRGVTAVGFGYLLLRRPPGAPTLQRAERIGGSVAGGLGEHLAEALAAHDRTVSLTDEQFAALTLRVAPDVTEERSYWPGDDDPTVIVLRQGGGFRREYRVGTALAAVVGACDGELPLGAILAAVGELLGVDRAALAAELIPELREFVLGGLARAL